jgi:hypothetical protein
MNSEDPYETACPGAPAGSETGCYSESLSAFDKLILVKVFRPEMIQQSCASYIIKEIGKYYAESPSVSMSVMY